MIRILFIAISILILFSCSNGIDPDITDLDSDGITGTEDIDDIQINLDKTMEETVDGYITTLTPIIYINSFNDGIVGTFWIQIAIDSENFDNTVIFSKDDYDSNECHIPSGILYNDHFYCRAKAYDNNEKRWSNSWSSIALISINNNEGGIYIYPENEEEISDSTPLLDWRDFSNAVKYHVQFGINEVIEENDSLTVSEYQITIPIENRNGDFWRIRYCTVDGGWSEWNTWTAFAVLVASPESPTPANGDQVIQSLPTLDWEDVADISEYQIQLYAKNESGTIMGTPINENITVSEFQMTSELNPLYTYYWQVKSKNEDGVWGNYPPWDEPWSFSLFQVFVAPPDSPSPANGGQIKHPLPILDWEDVDGVNEYQIKFYATNESGTIIDGTSIEETITESEFQVTTVLNSLYIYYWQVKSKNEDGVWGDYPAWDERWSFTLGHVGFTENVICDSPTNPSDSYLVDIDGDLDLDMLGTKYLDDDLDWWENNGTGAFTKHSIDTSFTNGNEVFAIDVDGDSDIDVIASASASDTIAWWENNGSESFTKHTITSSFDGVCCLNSADYNNDGNMDILGGSDSTGELILFLNDGAENFTGQIISDGSDYWDVYFIDTADVSGDGDLDLFLAVNGNHDIVWWENDGNGIFTEHVINNDFATVSGIKALDMDHDTDIDIVASSDYYGITWWENDGSENFTEHIIIDTIKATSLEVADLNMDNEYDIIFNVKDPANATYYLQNDGEEVFTIVTIDENLVSLNSVCAGDIDGDTDIDIVQADLFATYGVWLENDLIP